jgi:hypothetical protein
MPSVVAVVSVVAIVVALVAFFAAGGRDDVPQPQAAQQADSETPSQQSASPSPPGTPGARTTDRQRAGDDAPERATESEKAQRSEQKKDRRKQPAKRRPRPEPDTGPPDVYVEVYNNTSITGLAGSTAAELQDAGWQVVGVDNWRGDIPASTVYHPAGLEDEAQQLAETIGVGRVRGAVAPMKFDRLTVILTPDAA